MQLHIRDSWFDSSLHLNQHRSDWNAILEIRIRVCLNPYEPAAGGEIIDETDDPDGIRIVGWNSLPAPVAPRLTWAAYKAAFKREVETYWNNRLWLVPTSQWLHDPEHAGGITPTTIPNVSCRLRIQWATQANAHFYADVVRLHTGENFRRSSCRLPDWKGRIANFFGADDAYLDDLDVIKKSEIDPAWSDQIPILHEMGHYLGLNHVAGAGNDPAAYGDGYQGEDIMGSGVRLEPWHAFPWRKRLRQHIPVRPSIMQWAATTTRPAPRHAPPPPPRRRESIQSAGVNSLDGGL